MKKVIAFVGSARKKHTYEAVRRFLDCLQSLGEVESEIVVLSDYQLGTCRGCQLCFAKGEEFCPLKDDRDLLIGKIMAADGVVFATPNYEFQVSAYMKIFLDRLGFAFHRPRFFGKAFTSLVAQGFLGGGRIVKYLDLVGRCLGFNTVRGGCVTALQPMTEKERRVMDRTLTKQSRRFHKRLMNAAYPAPPFFMLAGFRMGRTHARLGLDETSRDYGYYQDKGWFTSDYFYPTRLGVLKKAAGVLFDSIAARMAKNRHS